MRTVATLTAASLFGLALAGCAHDSYREEPHHFSKDSRGNRVACFATEVADEYECVPAYRGYPYAYRDPFYDPYWGLGVLYYPAYRYDDHPARPAPRPAPPPRRRWHEKK